jgi:HAD superfamily hydrolase (TIGR01509 family)
MKSYLFDFDGTLVDSMPTFASVMVRILEENGIEYPDDIIKIITPLGYSGTAKYYREKLGLPLSEGEALERMIGYMKDEYTYRIPAKDGVPETLFELKKRGCSLNILTASPHDVLDPCLKRLGLYDVFDNVWSCNDFNTTKADPEIYRMAAEKIGSSVSSVTFLDDNLNADRTAKSAGMRVIGVYDESSRDYVEEMKAVCDGYIYNFKELMHP